MSKTLTIALVVVCLMGIGAVVAHGQEMATPAYQISMKPGMATVGQPVQFQVLVQNTPSFTVSWARDKHGRPEKTFTYRVEQDYPVAPSAVVITPQEPGTWYLLVDAPGMQQVAMIVPVTSK